MKPVIPDPGITDACIKRTFTRGPDFFPVDLADLALGNYRHLHIPYSGRTSRIPDAYPVAQLITCMQIFPCKADGDGQLVDEVLTAFVQEFAGIYLALLTVP